MTLISRADAIEALDEDVMGGLNYERILQSLPSAEANSEDLIIKGAKGIQDGKLFKYKANGGTVRTYPIVPSADAVQGEWEIEEIECVYGKKFILTCSVCGESVSVTENALPFEKYCRNCGAKMKGGVK